MAKARAICICKKCGNEFEKTTIKQNRSQADSWAEWAKDYFDECEECYHIRKQEEFNEANRKAAEEAKESGLATMTGSERQIAWAESIRKQFVDKMNGIKEKAVAYIEAVDEKIAKHPSIEAKIRRNADVYAKDIEIVESILEFLKANCTESRFWIDNRQNETLHKTIYGMMH